MKHKVLIVDDSKLARMSAKKALSILFPGWTSVEAGDGEQARKALVESAPDIALLDFNMPGQNGLDLAAELRTLRPDMPVAVISANRQQEVVDRARAVGAAFLAKPLTEAELEKFLVVAARQLEKAKT
jgi:CheY-like chemotaxis protein